MRRETSRAHIENLIHKLRAEIPGVALRTTFIVGFPGETGAEFENLLDFIRRMRFERLGIFKYSQPFESHPANEIEKVLEFRARFTWKPNDKSSPQRDA